MPKKAQPVTLSSNDTCSLKTLLTRGTVSARTLSRARILDLLHREQAPADIAPLLQVSPQTVFNVKRRYLAGGLPAALYAQPRSGHPVDISGTQRAKITGSGLLSAARRPGALDAATAGRQSRRTQLLRELVAYDGAQASKKNDLQPHLKKTWCSGKLDAAFLAGLEQVLDLYGLPFDAQYPVICFDERPGFLIGDSVAGLAMKAGQAARQHYAYEKHGSCALLAALEPKTGKRLARVFDQRTKREYAQFMQELAARYPKAKKLRIVQDSLNTHNISAFYATFSAEEAFALAQRFEFYYTPKSASGLNMIEFSALSKQCLNRRIAPKEELNQEVLVVVKEREAKAIKINWQFSIASARSKLNRHYRQINAENAQYQKT